MRFVSARLFKTMFAGLCGLVALALLGVGLIVLSDPWHPWLYLLDIFTGPVTMIAVVALLGLALCRQSGAALIGLLAVLCLYLSLAPDSQTHTGKPTGTPMRVLFANLWVQNDTPKALIGWIEAEQPDIITFVEANHRAHDHMIPALKADYPYVARRFDIYILSRWPLERIDGREPGFALLTARVKTPEGPVRLAVAHLTRPWPFTDPADQLRQMRRLETELAGDTERLILVGDFNSATHTGPMRDLRHALDLSAPAGMTGTWPSVLPGIGRIGIDHIMVGNGLSVANRRAGPAYGSDHSPVRADISLY